MEEGVFWGQTELVAMLHLNGLVLRVPKDRLSGELIVVRPPSRNHIFVTRLFVKSQSVLRAPQSIKCGGLSG